MTFKELQTKSREELERHATELRANIREMRFQAATKQLTKVRTFRTLKRDLAKVETLLTRLSTSHV